MKTIKEFFADQYKKKVKLNLEDRFLLEKIPQVLEPALLADTDIIDCYGENCKITHLNSETKTEWTIGRDETSDLTTDDITVSRKHATITNHEGIYCVIDNSSKNGTCINGKTIVYDLEIILGEQVELKFGDHTHYLFLDKKNLFEHYKNLVKARIRAF